MTACQDCGFIFENSSAVAHYRKVIFEVCPKCGRKLHPAPTVVASSVAEGDEDAIPATTIKRLED